MDSLLVPSLNSTGPSKKPQSRRRLSRISDKVRSMNSERSLSNSKSFVETVQLAKKIASRTLPAVEANAECKEVLRNG